MSVKTRKVDTILYGENKEIIFEKKGFEVPEAWSDQAALIAASKYATQDEYSVLEIIDRIVNTIADGGEKHGYFSAEEKEPFKESLKLLLVDQKCAFNSPIWMNIGVKGVSQQSSACFLGAIEDTMDDILSHMHRAGMVFKSGSGIGVNISKLRAANESLSNKGKSSGPLSFARAWDKSASAIKSAGRTRRSATLIGMEVDHPDIEEFIECKSKEEKKIKDLIGLGYSLEEANQSADFQNANHSIVLTDEFMNKVKTNSGWNLINRTDGKVAKKIKAKDLFRKIAQKAWETGDPGLQFTDTINAANPIPNRGNITTSNPCQPGWATVLTPEGIKTFDNIEVGSVIWSGYRWTKIIRKEYTGIKDVYAYETTKGTFYGTKNHRVLCKGEKVEVSKVLSIDECPYLPDRKELKQKSFKIKDIRFVSTEPVFSLTVEDPHHTYWSEGLHVSNCGEIYGVDWTSCLLVAFNLIKYMNRIDKQEYAFDTVSLEKDIKVIVTAMDILIEISDYPYKKFEKTAKETRPLGIGVTNLGAALMVCGLAYDSEGGRKMAKLIYQNITSFAANASIQLSQKVGPFKAFSSNVKETITAITNNCLTMDEKILTKAIYRYGIRNSQLTTAMPAGTVSLILDADTYGIEPLYRLKTIRTLVGGGKLEIIPRCVEIVKEEGYPEDVICTAESVHWADHVRMVSCLQKGISGGLSKTINMPSSATIEDVEEAYMMAWEEGLKGVTVYRDGSKSWQPLESAGKEKKEVKVDDKVYLERRRLPDDRESKTHHFNISGFEGYLTVGFYPGTMTPGEIFIRASKLGSTSQGMLDSFATVVSLALQYGIPLDKLVEKFTGTSYPPHGITHNPDIRFCTSVVDYIFNYLKKNFMETPVSEQIPETLSNNIVLTYDGPICGFCGQTTHRQGTCFVCVSCGNSTGCGG